MNGGFFTNSRTLVGQDLNNPAEARAAARLDRRSKCKILGVAINCPRFQEGLEVYGA